MYQAPVTGPVPLVARRRDRGLRRSARDLHILLWNGHPEAAHMAEDWHRVA